MIRVPAAAVKSTNNAAADNPQRKKNKKGQAQPVWCTK